MIASEEWELPDDENTNSGDTGSDDNKRGRGETDSLVDTKFVTGDELQWHRQKVLKMREALREARQTSNSKRVAELERAIISAQWKDAEFVYTVELDRMHEAAANGEDIEEIEEIRASALEARSALPQFNLEGLWVGK